MPRNIVRAHSPDLAFAGGTQRASVCLALLTLVDAAACWTPTGPAPGGQLAPPRAADPDTRTMLAACWALWEGNSTLSLHELLGLSPPRLEAVGELLAAIARGPAAIDAWLERHPPAQGAPAPRRAGHSELTRLLRSR